jgi:hypothetical protein
MKKVLVGLFYIVQGIGNLIFVIGAFTSDPKFGIGIGFFLLLPSIFSVLPVWELLKKKIAKALQWGFYASVLFMLFWGIRIVGSYNSIVFGYHVYHYTILLMISLIIVVLNVAAVLGLFSFARNKRI